MRLACEPTHTSFDIDRYLAYEDLAWRGHRQVLDHHHEVYARTTYAAP